MPRRSSTLPESRGSGPALLRTLTGESYRGFAHTLAESQLRQWFCRIGQAGGARVPSKSSLQSYSEMIDASGLRQVVMALVQSASSSTA